MNNFQIKSLSQTEFSELFQFDDADLEKVGAVKMIVDKKPGFPCRVSLQDAEIGEEVILMSYQYYRTNSPYQANGPIFIRKNGTTAKLEVNEIPEMLERRLLSLRAYDNKGMMKQAIVVDGNGLRDALSKIFDKEEISYIHIHNAKAGCFNCTAERA